MSRALWSLAMYLVAWCGPPARDNRERASDRLPRPGFYDDRSTLCQGGGDSPRTVPGRGGTVLERAAHGPPCTNDRRVMLATYPERRRPSAAMACSLLYPPPDA